MALAMTALQTSAQERGLKVTVKANGSYSVSTPGSPSPILTAGVAAMVNRHWLRSEEYPHHAVKRLQVTGYLGAASEWQVTSSGIPNEPELVYVLRAYRGRPFADLQVMVRNSTGAQITVQDIRVIDASNGAVVALGASPAEDRVLSGSFSEDLPQMGIYNLGDVSDHVHLGVGSQLIYNRESHENLFVAALTSKRFLTVLKLHVSGDGSATAIACYDVDSTGTTGIENQYSLQKDPQEDRVELSLPVAPGGSLASEQMLIGAGRHYHHELETYGTMIRKIHHARVSGPALMGWWSWTAFYFGLNHGTALTNAEWLSEHFKKYGYKYFHIDEGYDYARGEYVTPNATLFPDGIYPLEYKVRGLGLVPGVWTAPFEVSNRSWVYEHHRDWLVKNAAGKPIPIGHVVDGKDDLYVLDTTNPGAQHYLRETYHKLVHDWDMHYIKLDFMAASAIEGYHYKPDTTAMEAQRIGLKIIRKAVGNDVFLDKDGSAMLNPVGIVDYGRISQDTGHTFGASQQAATGIAARYYMNRNFFVDDPDAFSVSKQVIKDQSWHGGKKPLTYNAAKASIALAAVTGGMLEIGDNLPSLEHSPRRIALIENRNLIDMVKLGKAAIPMDLMSYAPTDQQPSIFFLHESKRQSILTVFNWTKHETSHTIRLSALGLPSDAKFSVTSVFDGHAVAVRDGEVHISLPMQDVSMLKIVNEDVPAAAPTVQVSCPTSVATGASIPLAADDDGSYPAVGFRWAFGDGVMRSGAKVSHAWTEPGDYQVRMVATGLDGMKASKVCRVHVSGLISTVFDPSQIKRYKP
jgi:hypothetical protein